MTDHWTLTTSTLHRWCHALAGGMQRWGALACLLVGMTAWVPQPTTGMDLQNLTPAEREALETLILDFIMANPSVIIESLQSYEQALAAREQAADSEAIARLHETLFHSPAAWSGGNPDGDVTIVEFLDYRCGFCRQMFEIVERVVEGDGNVRFVIKEFPILGEESMIMARLALAIRDLAGDEAYKTVHDTMMTGEGIEPSYIEDLATTYGLDPATISEGITSDTVGASLAETYRLAQELGINGTPAFIVGSQIIRGAMTEDQLIAAIAESRAAE